MAAAAAAGLFPDVDTACAAMAPQGAVRLAEAAARLTRGEDAAALEVLAAAYASAGRTDEARAVRERRQSIATRPVSGRE